MKTPPVQSLSHRAFLAAGLWAGFYLLALGLSGGLLFAAYWIFTSHRNPSFFLILCGIGAGIGALLILWSSFPRWQKFKPSGPRLDPKEHPKLFEEIGRIARDTHQKVPSDVYLDLDVNASVGTRGGLLGLFTRRVMTIGLPVLKVLTLSQFRSVLVHEFGHYVGGDTALGPWVYRTHTAIQRTVEMLEGSDSIWRFPFLAYGNLFLKTCLGVSQQQELAADALAAKVAGSKAAAKALRIIEGAGNAFPGFINDELLPVLNAKFRPPFCEGFERYLKAQDVTRFVLRRVGREASDRKRDPHRTHPPLGERLEAISKLPPGFDPREDPPAIELLNDLDRMETDVLLHVTGNLGIAKMPVLAWSDAAEKAFLPQWREQVKSARPHLQGVTPVQFPELKLAEVGHRVAKQTNDTDARSVAINALGLALSVSLRDRGWTLRMEPGERTSLFKDGVQVDPFHVFIDLAEGKLTRESWRERCAAGGFDSLDLGVATP